MKNPTSVRDLLSKLGFAAGLTASIATGCQSATVGNPPPPDAPQDVANDSPAVPDATEGGAPDGGAGDAGPSDGASG